MRVHQADETNPAGTSCWCIESLRNDEPRFWAGYFFSYEISEAVRFCRQDDAERVITEQFSQGKGLTVYVAVKQSWE